GNTHHTVPYKGKLHLHLKTLAHCCAHETGRQNTEQLWSWSKKSDLLEWETFHLNDTLGETDSKRERRIGTEEDKSALSLSLPTRFCEAPTGQPDVGRKQKEQRRREEGDDCAGSSLAFFCLSVSVTTGLISDRLALGKVTVREVSPPNRRPADEPTH
ncbi:hypothetical protein JOQ06_002880, partial [Pogonophryne albipinna]